MSLNYPPPPGFVEEHHNRLRRAVAMDQAQAQARGYSHPPPNPSRPQGLKIFLFQILHSTVPNQYSSRFYKHTLP